MLSVLKRIASTTSKHHNIHFFDKKISKMSLNICFLELLKEFPIGPKNEFESATVNEPSVFESLLKCHCFLRLPGCLNPEFT